MGLQSVPINGEGQVTRCPTCGYHVRLTFRQNKFGNDILDHYEAIPQHELTRELKSLEQVDQRVARLLRRERSGKKTVALVGMAPTSCSLAPYDEENIRLGGPLEIWGLNESHVWSWMKKWTRWFQLHPKHYWIRDTASRGAKGHYGWLKQDHGLPIYMQHHYEDVPNSIAYPLEEAIALTGKVKQGFEAVKYYTSTLPYMIALAILEGFQRIEMYGFEMAAGDEFVPQKACAEFWMGFAAGKGLEVYIPEACSLLSGPLYAYQGQGPRNVIG